MEVGLGPNEGCSAKGKKSIAYESDRFQIIIINSKNYVCSPFPIAFMYGLIHNLGGYVLFSPMACLDTRSGSNVDACPKVFLLILFMFLFKLHSVTI
jgi:hypothetical protein